jgi:hypothetical protein
MSNRDWLNAVEACEHLHIDRAELIKYLMAGDIVGYRSLSSGILFKRSELDALPTPMSGKEAGELITNSQQPQSVNAGKKVVSPEMDLMPLTETAKLFNKIGYKTLLSWANRGTIPAVNTGQPGDNVLRFAHIEK